MLVENGAGVVPQSWAEGVPVVLPQLEGPRVAALVPRGDPRVVEAGPVLVEGVEGRQPRRQQQQLQHRLCVRDRSLPRGRTATYSRWLPS